jgi:excisionase family DNA binding protein
MQSLLSARQVQDVLHIDRSTVYRMAEDGRLPAIRVGKQWRFPAQDIYALVSQEAPPVNTSPLDPDVSAAIADLSADLLGVMLVVTDMDGHPITPIANPCQWMLDHADDPTVVPTCIAEWQQLADDHNMEPQFQAGQLGFECARAFVRSGRELVGMVLAGGISPEREHRTDLYDLSSTQRRDVLDALPRIAVALSRTASLAGAQKEEKR